MTEPTVICVTPIKNEAWILDRLIIVLSSDKTLTANWSTSSEWQQMQPFYSHD